ncbi:MAG: VOC family protein [Ignavibacteria bacterium]|nr:VOC family protein [Ignavibacteria bacterium]
MQKVFGNLDKYLKENESLYFTGPIVSGIDHIVITVSDIENTCRFYHEVLGLEVITFAEGRKALKFGNQKINLHQAGGEYTPKAVNPLPGTADICFVSKAPVEATAAWLKSKNVEIIKGPVKRTGATGEMNSVYLRDPDGNLIELGCYHK